LFDGPSQEQDYPRAANPEEIEVPQPASSASYRPSATKGGTEGVRQQKSYQGRFASTSKRDSRSTRARSKFSDKTPQSGTLARSNTANRRIGRKTIGFDWGTLGLSDDFEGDRSSGDQKQNAIDLVAHEDEAIASDEYESVAP